MPMFYFSSDLSHIKCKNFYNENKSIYEFIDISSFSDEKINIIKLIADVLNYCKDKSINVRTTHILFADKKFREDFDEIVYYDMDKVIDLLADGKRLIGSNLFLMKSIQKLNGELKLLHMKASSNINRIEAKKNSVARFENKILHNKQEREDMLTTNKNASQGITIIKEECL